MKTALVLLFLALFVAVFADDACDPDGNGKPDCTGRSGQISRDFWDPTHYWECNGSGDAELVACPLGQGYTSKSGCVNWSVWEWTPPCPEVTA